MTEVRQLDTASGLQYLDALADVLLDCVDGGASVSFMAPLARETAEAFFENILQEVQRGECVLLAAFAGARLVGTVQIRTAMPPNQPHSSGCCQAACIAIRTRARNRARLIGHAEEVSRIMGKTLLVLDTATGGDGERLYSRLGWNKAGVVPNYALFPDGTPCSTTIFWKHLDSGSTPLRS